MKKIFAVAILFYFSSTAFSQSLNTSNLNKLNRIPIAGINTIIVNATVNVKFEPANIDTVIIEGSNLDMKKINLVHEGNSLAIGTYEHPNINLRDSLKLPSIVILYKSLQKIIINEVFSMTFTSSSNMKFLEVTANKIIKEAVFSLTCDKVVINYRGTGNLSLRGMAKNLFVSNYATAGRLNMSKLKSENLTYTSHSSVSSHVYAGSVVSLISNFSPTATVFYNGNIDKSRLLLKGKVEKNISL